MSNTPEERVIQLMETAQLDAVMVFDCYVNVFVKFENGVIMHQGWRINDGEEPNMEEIIRTCMTNISNHLLAIERARDSAPFTLPDPLRRVVEALAESSMVPAEAARKVGCSRSTMSRRIEKIRELTGKDPLDFFQLRELLQGTYSALREVE